MDDLKDNFGWFIKHRRQYKTQRTAFEEKKLTLEEGEVVCVVDFQERLQVQDQDEVQSQHWDREATTIFPCPIFFKLGGIVGRTASRSSATTWLKTMPGCSTS